VEEKQIQADLASIRSLMERSSKFISLSGLSGVLAGVYALIGAGFAYNLLYSGMPDEINPYKSLFLGTAANTDKTAIIGLFYGYDSSINIALIILPFLVLVASIGTGVLLTVRKAKRKNQAIWGPISRSLLFYMAIPLVSGGILIFILLLRGHYGIVASASLIFYGLSLVSASNFTFTMVKYLGLCEIALGLIAACYPGYGLLFWAIGFGVLHIIYGSVMYLKYDR
jgi:hypothetical protein